MYKLHILENNECGGFYKEGIHSSIPTPHITITTELWQYLLTLGKFKFLGKVENKFYTIYDKDLFEKVTVPPTDIPTETSLAERIRVLEQELAITQGALNEMLF